MDIGAGYNLLDQSTIKRLQLDTKKLPNNVFLRTISGGRLPIIVKAKLDCNYNGKYYQQNFIVSEYNLPYIIIGRQGMSQLMPGWKERLLLQDNQKEIPTQKTSLMRDGVLTKQLINQVELNTRTESLQ